MIRLLVLYIHFVATSPNSGLSRNVTTDHRNNACKYQRNMNESVVNMTPKIIKNSENPGWLAFDTTDLPALRREKRQRGTNLSPEEKRKKEEETRINFVKEKALTLMAQAMYAAQELIWPMEKVFKKYESDVPYRMAYIFLRMKTSMKEAKSIINVLETRRKRNDTTWTPTQRIQLYWQLMRKNTDVTYLVDYVNQRVSLGTEGVDTTLPPPTTAAPDSPDTTTPESTTHDGDSSQESTNLPRRRQAHFQRNFKMPGPGDNEIRAGIGLGKTQFARPVKRNVKRSTP